MIRKKKGNISKKVNQPSQHWSMKFNKFFLGLEACRASLKLEPQSADTHKWMAILIGARSDLQPIKERIQDGQLFKHHVDIAISINPADSSLHHMVGRFCYEVAGLKWFVFDYPVCMYQVSQFRHLWIGSQKL